MELRQSFEKNKKYIQIIGSLIITTIVLWFYIVAIHPYLSLATIKFYKDTLYHQTILRPIQSRCFYSLVYFALASGFLPIAALLNLLGGFLFGPLECIIMTTFITAAAALVNIVIVRSLLGIVLRKKYEHTFITFNAAFQKHGISYLLFMRLSGLFPFPIANILLGLTNVSLSTYLWTTSIGSIPGSLFFIYMGKQLGSIHSIKDILTWNILIVFLGFGLLSLLPVLYKKCFFIKAH